eukprot:TRINITY_DN9623_c0_g1_i1.p1 TRINITY_DN9623_c0_g1~~TRINITY_DN9623_c0_g1_i1.p1  ORF type:complete len:163 (-),score=44.95 TRINITY_DN9623_c0_g1_i1:41-475(-)
MASQSLAVLVSCLLAISVSFVVSESLASTCINYKFKCCPDVNYKVFSLTAQTLDDATCRTINYEFNYGTLTNATQSCKNAYTKMYCLLAVPQCCDASRPTVFQPCQSVCASEVQNCYKSGNVTVDCPIGLWYNPPCNSGSGISC